MACRSPATLFLQHFVRFSVQSKNISSVLLSSVRFCCSIARVLRYLASTSPNTKSKKESSKQANTQAKYKPSPLSTHVFCETLRHFPQTLWGPTLTVQFRKLSDMHFCDDSGVLLKGWMIKTTELQTLHSPLYAFYNTLSHFSQTLDRLAPSGTIWHHLGHRASGAIWGHLFFTLGPRRGRRKTCML